MDSTSVTNTEENLIASNPACSRCGMQLPANPGVYCSNCGQHLSGVKREEPENSFDTGFKSLGAFYLLHLIICCVVRFSGEEISYTSQFIAEGLLALVTIAFVASDWKYLKQLFTIKEFNPKLLLLIPCIIVLTIVMNIVIEKFNLTVFKKVYTFYPVYENFKYVRTFMLVDIAVIPAFFEEIGFRGFLFTRIHRYTGMRNSVIISAAAFSIIHMSLLSLIWLFPFAIFLGYLRAKYNTIWYGVIMHFTLNATTCAMEWYHQGLL